MTALRILVVDDDRDARRLLTTILQEEGYRVDQAGTGTRALDLLQKIDYQIVFLDIRLPEMSGLELLAKLKKNGRKIEVIIHTAYASLQTSIQALNQGALMYIIKPFHPQEVRLAASRAIKKWKLEMDNIRLINNLKKKNVELKIAYRKLEDLAYHLVISEKMAALTTLGGGIAHELNNPLTSIMGLVELLLAKERIGPVVRDKLEKIRVQVKRCASIVKDLLIFTRQVSGKIEDVDCSEIMNKVLVIMEYRIKKSGVTIKTNFQKDMPSIRANPGQLGQVFLNMLINALEAVGDGKDGQVELSTKQLADEVLITFQDNGRGIPREQLSRIFEPFFTSKETGEGAGLGLAVCEGIVNSLGGKITVESKIEEGSLFQINLPVLTD